MNSATRTAIVLSCFALCASGLVSATREWPSDSYIQTRDGFNVDELSNYQFAASDLQKFSFGQLEAIIRADAANKSPRSRIELGSVRVEGKELLAQVTFFGPDDQTQAFLYKLVPKRNTWKIAKVQRLWFVPRSQLVRGLRV